MPAQPDLTWPFFDEPHRAFAARLQGWAAALPAHDDSDVDATCRDLVQRLGRDGWLQHTVPGKDGHVDVRSLCIARETLAYHDGLADFAFAMQGLGAGPISFFGTDAQRAEWLPRVAAGDAIAAFALSEPEAGSDVAAMAMTADETADGYVLNGCKTWISNGGIADFYTVFARTGAGSKGITAFVVDAKTPGLEIEARIEVIAPHPLATLRFTDCRVPHSARIGEPGAGMRIALGTLDIFRSTVGAAALGFARRAMDESVQRAAQRQLFGNAMAELQLIQGKLADMAVDVDAATLLVYRAAWLADQHTGRVTREAAIAKLFATEAAQRAIDDAVQIFGGHGVVRGNITERLYREIRALRIYEGASEVQKIVIARQTLAGRA
ncbi:acyl-CoA dehydrogenase family protein [Roseiterribacter gracilis]|uniref:Acyl-CoA dehydrogenase n=1 Tax=Roseiterribacter gracilis TaxID=2812848 RepID=A0A8S8X7K5_9PROT|nr:acyl-CoA dehydrogenase [Rhodospirillales bacterium TMPK1]